MLCKTLDKLEFKKDTVTVLSKYIYAIELRLTFYYRSTRRPARDHRISPQPGGCYALLTEGVYNTP